MGRLYRLVLPALLVGLLTIGLSNSVSGQIPPRLSIENAPSTVLVSTTFEVEFWILDIPDPGMNRWLLIVSWDPALMELAEEFDDIITREEARWNSRGWLYSSGGYDVNLIGFIVETGDAPWTEDALWFTLNFHCLGPGSSSIRLGGLDEVELAIIALGSFEVFPEDVYVTIQQTGTVGGIVSPINKLAVLTPYLALAGLIIAVSTVYIIKRRKD